MNRVIYSNGEVVEREGEGMDLYVCCTKKQLERDQRRTFNKQNKAWLKRLKEKDPQKVALNSYQDYIEKNPWMSGMFRVNGEVLRYNGDFQI